jgi:hypothetical protein
MISSPSGEAVEPNRDTIMIFAVPLGRDIAGDEKK